ncbi:hypothetical protein HC341_04225 [Aquisalimonas sp. 2447]|uniref:hypothetical protein n=1 Tax=Aquisalimonas sp. 2447 TaxID=2740807 RepID=UPI0014323B38|nr:hypothetical protein [Aquisalimonas sp. 2447]QIT54492.1 hypothetical protein HC341_04225 [Aquisalimonas sp. 2447]
MKVTFDSNVWRIVSSPDSFPNESAIAEFRRIHDAIAQGTIEAYLAETVFTLEAVKKSGRHQFLAEYKAKVNFEEKEQPDGSLAFSIGIGPDPNAHPGNNHYLSKHWADAEKIGFKILHCTRLATAKNPDLKSEWFIPVTHDIAERFGTIGRDIEAQDCGISQLKAIGQEYASSHEPWHAGISAAPDSEEGPIAKAVAEWADGDAISAHYAYGNDYVCTRDIAKAAGNNSVFSAANRTWLEQRYGVQFLTPEELARLV